MKLSKACRVVCNIERKRAVLANIETGKWVLIPLSCLEILKVLDKKKILLQDIYENAFDKEDRSYLRVLFSKLIEMKILVSNDVWMTTYRSDIQKVYINLTYRCNLNCRHCCVEAKHVTDFTKFDELNTEMIKKVVDKIVELNPKELVLSGGEPMIRDDFYEVLLYIREKYTNSIDLSSNATLINTKNINILKSCVDKFDISLDGVDEISCSKIRGKGVFTQVMNSIALLKKNNVENIYLSMMFSDFNENLRQDFLDLCKELSVHPLMRAFEPMGRGAKNWTEFEKEEVEKHAEVYSELELKRAREEMCCFSCGAGRKELMINPRGDIFPCGNLNSREFCLGNILQIDNLTEYLDEHFQEKKQRPTGFSELEDSFPYNFQNCKKCNVNLFCWSCISGIKNRFAERARFDEECKDKKKILEQLVWGIDK